MPEQRDRERAHRIGAVCFLTKPVDPVELPAAMDDIVGRLERGERERMRGEVLSGG